MIAGSDESYALDDMEGNPDDQVGDPTFPEHDLDVSAFTDDEDDTPLDTESVQ